ncbi:hypothetical protein Tco_0405446 [Tanacetum coccineum]
MCVDESSLSDGLGLRYLGILDYSTIRVPIQTYVMVLLFGHVVCDCDTGLVVAAGLTIAEVGAIVAGVVAVENKHPFVEDKFALKSDVAHDCVQDGA